MRKVILIFLLSGILLFSIFVLAKTTASDCNQYCSDPATYDPLADQVCICNPLEAEEFEVIVDNIINFLFKIAIVLAPLMIVIGAALFVTSGGNLTQITRAKNIILWTAVGFLILLLAKGIMALIESILGIE